MLSILISMPNVVSIREQVAVHYSWGGAIRKYTFDFVATERAGHRIALAVKHSDKALRSDDTIEIVEAIAAEHGSNFADEYRAVSYESLDPIALGNAKLILDCGRDQDIEGQRLVEKILADLGPMVTLRDIAEAAGLGYCGIRAAIALIQSGILMPPRGLELTIDLPMQNRGTRSAMGNQSR